MSCHKKPVSLKNCFQNGYEQAFSLVESSDGGFALAGYATSSDAVPPGLPGPESVSYTHLTLPTILLV